MLFLLCAGLWLIMATNQPVNDLRVPTFLETLQAQVWQGEFGQAYTDRNTLEPSQLDALWATNYGITRTQITELFLSDIPKHAAILEVGCNIGNQLKLLQELGYTNLAGVELQPYALDRAKARLQGVVLRRGSVLALPFQDAGFDVVFTSGVLIHIAPEHLAQAIGEIHRCSKRYVWGSEYFANELTPVNYRGHEGLLWKADYARMYLAEFKDLRRVRECHLRYLANDHVDSVFLLEKLC